MKKMKSILGLCSILFTMSLLSCSPTVEDEIGKETKKKWIEPFHERNGSIDQAKSYMIARLPSYRLVTETSSVSLQLIYESHNTKEGIIYSFSTRDSLLYSVIDTELIRNNAVVLKFLNDHYTLVEESSNPSLYQFVFTNEDRSLAITTSQISDECFNVNYTYIIE